MTVSVRFTLTRLDGSQCQIDLTSEQSGKFWIKAEPSADGGLHLHVSPIDAGNEGAEGHREKPAKEIKGQNPIHDPYGYFFRLNYAGRGQSNSEHPAFSNFQSRIVCAGALQGQFGNLPTSQFIGGKDEASS